MEPPPEMKRGPRIVRDAFNALRQWMIGQQILPSIDCDIHETPQGKVIFVKQSTSHPGSKSIDHPFKVLTRQTSSGQPQAGVVHQSSLYLSLRPNHKFPVTGLLSADQSSGWFNLSANDAIWLKITFNANGQVSSANINSLGRGDSFNLTANAWSNNSYCEDDGDEENPKHQTSRKLIAYATAGSDGKPVVTQVMFRDQVLRNVCIDGRPARYPFDHEGGYPL